MTLGGLSAEHDTSVKKDVLSKFTNLKPDRINLMSRNCRTFAETHLSEEKMVNSYETLFENLIASEKSVESIEA